MFTIKSSNGVKAKYIGRYIEKDYNKTIVSLEYEYRGHKYTVYDNRSQGGEPLSWQHKNHQAQIDRMIEMEEKECKTESSVFVDDVLKELIDYWDK